tara:strand:- start:4104 stop:4253 length:150 start_codon:yes stop_codon:yes gene_type:complete
MVMVVKREGHIRASHWSHAAKLNFLALIAMLVFSNHSIDIRWRALIGKN